jgi:hypothetical protein
VQIKKGPADDNNTSSSSTSHIVCPFCMTKEFGIIYTSPSSTTIMDDEKKVRVKGIKAETIYRVCITHGPTLYISL